MKRDWKNFLVNLKLKAYLFFLWSPLIILFFVILSSKEKKQEVLKPKFSLEETIQIEGICKEDHANKSDHYSGEIVRWRNIETRVVSAYGFVEKPIKNDTIIYEAQHSRDYHTPFIVSFDDIKADTSLSKWVLHGVSDRGEFRQGYKSTCNVSVVSRGNKFPK